MVRRRIRVIPCLPIISDALVESLAKFRGQVRYLAAWPERQFIRTVIACALRIASDSRVRASSARQTLRCLPRQPCPARGRGHFFRLR